MHTSTSVEALRKIRLAVRRERRTEEVMLTVAKAPPADEAIKLANVYLHERERLYWETLQHPDRRVDYLLGRIAAKSALGHWYPELSPRRLEIAFGAFGQPIAKVPDSGHEVSVAHSGGHAVALAFPAGLGMAIDREPVASAPELPASPQSNDRLEALRRQMTARERGLVRELDEAVGLAILWTAKESLSKALRCGLTVPFRLLEVRTCHLASGEARLTFRNFPQYQALVRYSARVAQSVLLPHDAELITERLPLFDDGTA